MNDYLINCAERVLEPTIFSLIYTLSRHKILVLKVPGAKEISVQY